MMGTSAVKPLIKKLQTDRNKYVYDANTNDILRVDDVVYDLVDSIGGVPREELVTRFAKKHGEPAVRDALEQIDEFCKGSSFLSSGRPSRLEFPLSREQLEEVLDRNLGHLILGITEACNLRCRYCVYSGDYPYQRRHGVRHMSPEVAKAAVEFYARHSRDCEDVSIGFYGGEPLLNFPVIEECVLHIRKTIDREILLNITTNGTLLTGAVGDFLVENDVYATVSLDGPRAVHDRYRVTANGEGTFDTVLTNLRSLKRRHPEYYCSHVTFGAVLGPPLEVGERRRFFAEDEATRDNRLNLSDVDATDTHFFDGVDPSSLACDELVELRQSFIEACAAGTPREDEFLKSLYEKNLLKIYKRRLFEGFDPAHYPNGICVPGVRRLFVGVDGGFYLCERINDGLKIGNVETGFDHGVIHELIQDYCALNAKACCDCWAVRLCGACFVSAFTNKLDEAKMAESCRLQREAIEHDLNVFASILERAPRALDYMKEMSLS